jgi:hypothetical protein
MQVSGSFHFAMMRPNMLWSSPPCFRIC